MGKNRRLAIIYLLIFVGIVALVIVFWPRGEEETPPSLSEVTAAVEAGRVSEIEIVDDRTLIVNEEGREPYKTTIASDYVGDFIQLLKDAKTADGTPVNIDVRISYSSGFNWGSFLLTVVPLAMLVVLFIFIMRGARGANNQAFNFSRSRARLADGAKPTVTFTDVAGVEEAKQELPGDRGVPQDAGEVPGPRAPAYRGESF